MHAGGRRFESDHLHQMLALCFLSIKGDALWQPHRGKDEEEKGKEEARKADKASKDKTGKRVGKVIEKIGQATKGTRRMPWRWEPKKDVVSCEKPRGAANRLRSGDVRMGKPAAGNAAACASEYIGCARERGELKHLMYPQEKRQ